MKIAALKSELTCILKSEQSLPPADQTRWIFRPPTLQDRINYDSEFVAGVGNDRVTPVRLSLGDIMRRDCRLIKSLLIRVENLSDAENQPVVWEKDKPELQDNILARIPRTAIAELAGEMIKSGFLPDAEKKS